MLKDYCKRGDVLEITEKAESKSNHGAIFIVVRRDHAERGWRVSPVTSVFDCAPYEDGTFSVAEEDFRRGYVKIIAHCHLPPGDK